MSTRANIVLQQTGYTLWLYHHFDGYPSWLGKKLMQIMEKHKYDDDIFDIANEMFKDKEDDGFEITKSQHGDIEYLYLINTEKHEITCFRPDETILKRVKYNDDTDIQEWYDFCKKDEVE